MRDSNQKPVNHRASREALEANTVQEKRESFLHSVYIFPKSEMDKAMILKFAQELDRSKVYYIKSIRNSLESFENVIEDDQKELVFDDRDSKNDNEPFLTFLNVTIKNIEKDKAIRRTLKVNGSFCQMLVLSNNCSKPKSLIGPLRKKLGEIIENESIQHFLSILKVANLKKQTKNTTLKTKRPLENQSTGEKSKKPKLEKGTTPTTFKSQEAIANELYRRIKAKLNKFDCIDLEEEFEDFEFLILLPNRCSLEEQTVERIKEKFTKKENLEKNVIRICPNSNDLQNKWDCFIQRVGENPKKFFLVIHDECHWAAGTKICHSEAISQKSRGTFEFLRFDQGDYHYLNGKLLPNLFTVMVSATPYNFFTSPYLETEDILYWNQHLGNLKLENTYQGLTHFRKGTENCKMLSSASEMINWWGKNQDHFALLIQNGFTKEFILVLLDYCTAISDCSNSDQPTKEALNFPLTPQIKTCVNQCIQQNSQIIVRLDSAFDAIRQTEVAKIVLQKFLDVFKQQIEVMVLTSTQEKLHMEDEISDNTSKIILVIEMFRMGDTFPKTCICFDLRARYLFPVKDFTSIIQDVGRAFGYSKRPLLLLSQQANDFLTDIWDSNTGYISWDSLKTKLKSTQLGKNTIRKSQIPTVQTTHQIYISIPQEDGEEPFTIEVDPTETVIQQFQEIYDHDPKDPVFLFRLKLTGDCSAFKHRTFLKADPQNGKTGAFLHLAFLLNEFLSKDPSFLENFTTSSYIEKSLDAIKQYLRKPEGKIEHKKYLIFLGRARKNPKKKGILEPSKWASLCLIKNLLKNCQQNQSEIQIADFGCGDMQFANCLCEELQKKPELATTKICIHAFDISPNDIPISDQLHSSQQIRIVLHPGVSCGDSREFQAESFDYIISTLALFGNGDSWKEIIETAFFALRKNGLFFLAECKKYLPPDIAQHLEPAGVVCEYIKLGN
jgi:hypothetical protein